MHKSTHVYIYIQMCIYIHVHKHTYMYICRYTFFVYMQTHRNRPLVLQVLGRYQNTDAPRDPGGTAHQGPNFPDNRKANWDQPPYLRRDPHSLNCSGPHCRCCCRCLSCLQNQHMSGITLHGGLVSRRRSHRKRSTEISLQSDTHNKSEEL